MSNHFSPVEACASALMKSWFPTRYNDESWLQTEDGQQWYEIAVLDSQTVIRAYNDFLNETYK